jgi:hypothetical protein
VLLPLELEQRSEPFLRLGAQVHERRVGGHAPLQNAEEVDPARERIGDGLEHEDRGGGAVRVDGRALLGRRGNALDEEVEESVRAEVLRRDTTGDGEDLPLRDRGLQRCGNLVRVELLALEVSLHQALVSLDHCIQKLLAVLGGDVGHLVRDRPWLGLLRAFGARVRAHVQDVDDPGQLVLHPDRDVDRDALGRELRAKLLQGPEEVGPLAIEHVDEDDSRQPELLAELPRPGRPDLGAHDTRHRDEHALDDPRGGPQLALEARIAGDVDQVELALLPGRMRERHRDRGLPLVLVLVRVRNGRAGLDGAKPVERA